MTKLILIRHAETEGNLNGIWNGVTDAPLTQRGIDQIEATAQHMAKLVEIHPLDHFYVSPMGRTRATAAAISEQIRMESLVENDLREFDLGDWEGRAMKDLAESENLWGRWEMDPSYAPPNGESPALFRARSLQIIDTLVARHTNKTILAVTHGGVIGNVLGRWFGAGQNDWAKWEPHNCAISMLEFDGRRWSGSLINDVGHLPTHLVVQPNHDYAELSE